MGPKWEAPEFRLEANVSGDRYSVHALAQPKSGDIDL
jgi:hypothetical protein